MESNNAGPQFGNCFVCNEPGHRKRDCPVFKTSLIEKGINNEEHQAEYDKKGLKYRWGTDWVGEPLEREVEVTRGVAIQAEVVAGVLPLTMAHRDRFRKQTLYPSNLITWRCWIYPKSCGLTTGKAMKNTRVSCETYKAC